MRTEPVFCGKIHITAVKNNKWFWYDFITTAKQDKKILEFAKTVCPDHYTTARQHIREENGKTFREIIEKAIGEKIDAPADSAYSVTYSKNYNPIKKKDSYSILLFCEENFIDFKKCPGDRTAIDIYI